MAAHSPHILESQEDLFASQPHGQVSAGPVSAFMPTCVQSGAASFTPLLRGNELGSSPADTDGVSTGSTIPAHLFSGQSSQPYSPAPSGFINPESQSPNYQSENPFHNSNPATPIVMDPSIPNSGPSTPVQLSSPSSSHHLHSTPHGPASLLAHHTHHAESPIHHYQHHHPTIAGKHVPSNCSPLVKGDMDASGQIVRTSNTPQAKRNIQLMPDNSGSYFNSLQNRKTLQHQNVPGRA